MDSNEKWNYMYELLVKYNEEYGNTEVPFDYVTEDGIYLGRWVNDQRQQKNKLSMSMLNKLISINFRFDNIDIDEHWDYMYELLVEYKKEYGNTEVPFNYVTEDGIFLGRWVNDQRIDYKCNKLSINKIDKLNLVDFKIEIIDSNMKWNYMHYLLAKYKKKYGNTDVPISYVTEDGENLGQWASFQRRVYNNNSLSLNKINRLRLLGFIFDINILDEEWNFMYSLLVKYREKNGNIDIPISYVTEYGEKLGIWVYLQWAAYNNNILSIDKLLKLWMLNFKFTNSQIVNSCFNRILDFELIKNICLEYRIDYNKCKLIFDKLSYDEFVSRLCYILDCYMDIVDDNGNLNIIFSMDNENLYLYTGYTSEVLILYYNKERIRNIIKTRKR